MSWPSKYAPLQRYLVAQSGDQLVLTFAAIEAIIGAPLPATAGLRTWWGNAPNWSHARAWQAAGWRVASVNFGLRQVTFVRREVTP
jgi:hypothetical protein